MKQLYLMYCMGLLLDVGTIAQENGLFASRAGTTHQNSNWNLLLTTNQTALDVTGRVTDENGADFPGVNFRRSGYPVLSPNLCNNNLNGGFARRLSYPDYEGFSNAENYKLQPRSSVVMA